MSRRLMWGVLEWPIGLFWAFYAWLVRATSRVTVTGSPHAGAAVYVNWHRFQPFLIPHHGAHSRWMLVSPAPPLAPVARFCRLSGLNLIRGTSGDRGKQALEELVQVVQRGQSITIAVDGPAGPPFEVKRGCVDVASRTGAPIVPVAYSCRRGGTIEWRWDKTLMPAPFDHITIHYGTPILVDASPSDHLARVTNALNELMLIAVLCCPVLLASVPVRSAAQAPAIDPALLAQVRRIHAIDNHSHPPKLVSGGEKDDEFDALPCDPLEPTQAGLLTRPENPQYIAAWRDLWGYRYDDRDSAHVRTVLAAKDRARAAHGDYNSWVLGRVGIDVELSNRVAMGRGLNDSHHRWVPFDDALIFPLDNAPLAEQTPDRRFFFSREDMLRTRYMKELGVAALPATLGEYVKSVVTPELERQKREGAVAIKFEAAYLRSLDFGPAAEQDVASFYGRYARGGKPDTAEYRHLQDFLFRYVAVEAGRLGMPVHIHTGGGCGGYFYLKGSYPTLLEPVLNDPALRKTTFVLLHGGAISYTPAVAYLAMKPNVFVDMSQQTWMESAPRLATTLRYWLEWFPEKVLFGTDLYPTGAPDIGWEEIAWQTSENARRALGIALTGMMRDGEITRPQALTIAREVLHDNAAKLYGIGTGATP